LLNFIRVWHPDHFSIVSYTNEQSAASAVVEGTKNLGYLRCITRQSFLEFQSLPFTLPQEFEYPGLIDFWGDLHAVIE
jgi:hypothetical protein